jgi:hypothetical protein
MAGDLYIQDISYDQFQTLKAAGGVVEEAIFHADRGFAEYENVLNTRLAAGPPCNRVNLPAHGYVAFRAANRGVTQGYAAGVNRLRLGNFLEKVSRPLGVVAANANLNAWNATLGPGRVNLLAAALNNGNVVIEYYKYDGSPILFVQRGWAHHNE